MNIGISPFADPGMQLACHHHSVQKWVLKFSVVTFVVFSTQATDSRLPPPKLARDHSGPKHALLTLTTDDLANAFAHSRYAPT
jgi:hypothetical protein